MSNGTDYQANMPGKCQNSQPIMWGDSLARTASLIFLLVPGGKFVTSVDVGEKRDFVTPYCIVERLSPLDSVGRFV